MSGSTGGLGRGLAAILTGPSLSGHEQTLRARFVDSALASLSGVNPLWLCGYVHQHGDDVDVTLRAPELRSLHPTQAYQLFTAVSSLVDEPVGRHPFQLGEMPAMAVMTTGEEASGMFFFGDATLDSILTDQLASFCEVYAPVLHDHERPARDHERLHLVLDQEGGAVHAEVAIGDDVGFGSAARSHQAAALAAVNARCPQAKLVDVGEVRAGDGGAAFVVVAGELGRIGMGAAPFVAGPDAAAALAALRAASVLVG